MQNPVYYESRELRREQFASLLVVPSLTVRLIAKLDLFLGPSALQPYVRLIYVVHRFLFACFEQCIVWIICGRIGGTGEVGEDVAIGCAGHYFSEDLTTVFLGLRGSSGLPARTRSLVLQWQELIDAGQPSVKRPFIHATEM